MSSVKTYKVTQVVQLIELNSQNPQFDIDFFARSTEDFSFLVIDQTALDSGGELQFRKSRGNEISGNIKGEDGLMYYLALKSLSKNVIDVEVSIVPRPITVVSSSATSPSTEKKVRFQDVPEPLPGPPPIISTGREWNLTTKILLAVVVIGGVVGLYFFWNASKKRSQTDTKNDAETPDAKNAPPAAPPPAAKADKGKKKDSLLERLKELPGSSNKSSKK
tara:strand:- start:262 stop:921 length:660 start_codon:yes stop_codon:yes gene_type:complete